MRWICLMFLFGIAHGLPEYSCPVITDIPQLQAKRLRHNDLLSAIDNSAINLAATDVGIDKLKWPMGETPDHKYEIPYVFEDTIKPSVKENFYFAMVIIERGTNLIFVEKRHTDKDYINIQNRGQFLGCYNLSLGDGKNGSHVIQISPYCACISTITHELLHAVGLHHEHQRADRPIAKSAHLLRAFPGNSESLDWVVGLTPYDPYSIMHYKLLGDFKLDKSKGWTDFDNGKASLSRVFPTPCDFSGVNELYKGLRSGPPCKDVEIHPMLLHAPKDAEKEKAMGIRSNGSVTWYNLTWLCNWGGGDATNPFFSSNRTERDRCQLENNRMYPDFSWIPNAAEETIPLAGVDYKDYKVSPNRNPQEYPPQHMCDCLPPPLTKMGFTDNSMFQKCLECVHFKRTTDGVLRCIAGNGVNKNDIYTYLKSSYPSSYYVSDPQ